MLRVVLEPHGSDMAAVVDRETFILPRSVAPDVEAFAVGDIHGRPDLLRALLDEASREPRRRPRRAIVFLGDLVDRGPDSLGAIDLASGAGTMIGAEDSIALMGNHEAMMRLALDPKTPFEAALDALGNWLNNGGAAAVRQFASFDVSPGGPEELLTVLRVALPERVRRWLESLRTCWRSQDVLFVHAGVNPRVDLDEFLEAPWNAPLAELDEDRHWAWVRWPFLEFEPGAGGFSGLFVVHGHTPNDARRDPSHARQIANYRLNLDAGSGITGRAKMAVFRGDEVKVLTALGPTNRMLQG
ncbi:MAG: metallophosphoesterase [Hyphomicrobiales bacterium]|nr:metallophosphoesterase [Hyphomicrobiales bacterium]